MEVKENCSSQVKKRKQRKLPHPCYRNTHVSWNQFYCCHYQRYEEKKRRSVSVKKTPPCQLLSMWVNLLCCRVEWQPVAQETLWRMCFTTYKQILETNIQQSVKKPTMKSGWIHNNATFKIFYNLKKINESRKFKCLDFIRT